MKMTEKTKRNLAIGGGTVICIALIAAIGLQFGKAPAGEDVLPVDTPPVTEAVVNPGEAATEKTEEKELVLQPGGTETEAEAGTKPGTETKRETETESTRPVDTRPAQTDQSEQSIQPEVTKPAGPEEAVKTDPTQKPDGTKVETPPEPVEHEKVAAPPETPPAPEQPQGGETQDGKVYLPGFGWVTDTGSSGITAEDMYENGNKIGDMGN